MSKFAPEPEASNVLHLPHGIITTTTTVIIMSKIKNDESFTKRDFRPYCACHEK